MGKLKHFSAVAGQQVILYERSVCEIPLF